MGANKMYRQEDVLRRWFINKKIHRFRTTSRDCFTYNEGVDPESGVEEYFDNQI